MSHASLFDRSGHRFGKSRRVDATIDMTPMIDTLLQLFVVFMLNMTFAASALPLDLPKGQATSNAPTEAIIISLMEDDFLYFGDVPIDRAQLVAKLRERLDKDANTPVTLRAERRLPYEQVMQILDLINQSGAEKVHLAYELSNSDAP